MNLPLSVIIPTLDEAALLPALIETLQNQAGVELEIIVADGGSRDDTVTLARRAGVVVVESEAGRGRQMNAGAAAASGELLLFLHADSQIEQHNLLATALNFRTDAVTDRGHRKVAGHFSLRFRCAETHCSPLYTFMEAKSQLNYPYTTNGDQGMLFHRAFFDDLGGFDESLPFLEDQKIAREVRRHGGEWLTLPGVLWTSARRFEREGLWQRYLSMGVIMTAFGAGIDSFFRDLPELYLPQSEAEKLHTMEHLRALGRTLAQMPPTRRLRALRSIARFAVANAWQLALLAELAAGQRRRED